MSFDWFTVDWAKRWMLPVCALSLGIGSIVGASIWRFSDYPELAASRPSTTITVTSVPPLGDLSALDPVTSVVKTTATVTAPPSTREITVTKAVPPVTETVQVEKVKERNRENQTETVTVTAPPREVQVVNPGEGRGPR
jgi:hypothetical protein